MHRVKTHFQTVRSQIHMVTHTLSKALLVWAMILLVAALYYVGFIFLIKLGTTMEFELGSIVPVLLGAWLKARRGALLGWLLVLPSLVLNAVFAVGAARPTSPLEHVLSASFALLLVGLAVGQFCSISNRLDHAYQQLRETHDELAIAHATSQRQALIDALTSLPNNRAVMDQLGKELERARRYHRTLSVLFFDADRFKKVNDTHGHGAGDAVLRQIGERAASALRGGDTIGRFGGEEFVILLPEADADEARSIAERIRAAVTDGPVATSEVEGGLATTISIGLSTYPFDGESEQVLLSQADAAMYIAKRLGRNQVRSAEEARQMGADVSLMALLQEGEQREAAQREGVTPEQQRETYTMRMINSLLSLLERRDAGLSAHALAVSDLATAIAQRRGRDPKEVSRIGMAALLHDIGKVAIPDALLQKVGPLSSQEHALLQEHAELGAEILESSPFLDDLLPAVRHHHERWDGGGYPDQLCGEAIPLSARIIAVAEAYDFIQRTFLYHVGCSPEEALAELEQCAGTQFDPAIVQSLIEVLRDPQEHQYSTWKALPSVHSALAPNLSGS